MEGLVDADPAFWKGRRVLLTGHTGFKGAWLWLWLQQLGAIVSGFALKPPPERSLWRDLDVVEDEDWTGDVRNAGELDRCIQRSEPEIVFHLAAQALVRRSYAEPTQTIATNVVGTMNLLDAARRTSSVKAMIIVTTDKVYHNREWIWPYREDDHLGGRDPYSASKACAEIITAAWRQSFLSELGVKVATARAGNVIGGGDWSSDRLLPDCIEALSSGRPIRVRNPNSTRPWQHVLEPLSGYLLLAQALCQNHALGVDEAWNFGPDPNGIEPVAAIVEHVVKMWGADDSWERVSDSGPHEAALLALDASKARARLRWRPRLALRDALAWTIDWAKRYRAGEAARNLVCEQIERYEAISGIVSDARM